MIVAGGAVAAISVLRDDAAETDGTDPTWNVIVDVERTTGAARVLDDTGAEVATITGSGPVLEVHARDDRLALIGPSQMALTGLDDDEPTVVELDASSTIERLDTNRSLAFVLAREGNLVIVDGATGDRLDVGQLADQTSPMLISDSLRSDAAATAFAVGDGRNFQTIVVRFDEDEATFFPGVPMAVADELVVTSTTVGAAADIGFFDRGGDRIATVSSERPVGGTITEGGFVYVTESGAVKRASPATPEPDQIGGVSVPFDDVIAWVRPALDGERLVVGGHRFVAVVDLDGDRIFQTTFMEEVPTTEPWATWRCLPVGGDETYHSLIDLETGDELADMDGVVVEEISIDGCGLVADRDGDRISIGPDGEVDLPDTGELVSIAPDGTAVVHAAAGGQATLHRVGDADQPVDLGQVGTVVFAER